MINENKYQFHGALPNIAGYWILPGSNTFQKFSFAMPAKPNWFHRQTMRLLLGWKWEDV